MPFLRKAAQSIAANCNNDFCGKSQKTITFIGLSCLPNTKMKAQQWTATQELHSTQIKWAKLLWLQSHLYIYIHHMYLSCVSNVFPRYIFQPGGCRKVLSVGDPNVPRTLGMLPWEYLTQPRCGGGNRKRTWLCRDNMWQSRSNDDISLNPKATHSCGAWRNHQTVAFAGQLVRYSSPTRGRCSHQIKPQPTVIDYIQIFLVSSVGEWIHLFFSSCSLIVKIMSVLKLSCKPDEKDKTCQSYKPIQQKLYETFESDV